MFKDDVKFYSWIPANLLHLQILMHLKINSLLDDHNIHLEYMGKNKSWHARLQQFITRSAYTGHLCSSPYYYKAYLILVLLNLNVP